MTGKEFAAQWEAIPEPVRKVMWHAYSGMALDGLLQALHTAAVLMPKRTTGKDALEALAEVIAERVATHRAKVRAELGDDAGDGFGFMVEPPKGAGA